MESEGEACGMTMLLPWEEKAGARRSGGCPKEEIEIFETLGMLCCIHSLTPIASQEH